MKGRQLLGISAQSDFLNEPRTSTYTYATRIGLRLGLSLPSPVGITIIALNNIVHKLNCWFNMVIYVDDNG